MGALFEAFKPRGSRASSRQQDDVIDLLSLVQDNPFHKVWVANKRFELTSKFQSSNSNSRELELKIPESLNILRL